MVISAGGRNVGLYFALLAYVKAVSSLRGLQHLQSRRV